jgi:hypothetical protein
MKESNLMASFTVKCYGNGKNEEILRLIIHDKQIVAESKPVNNSHYEDLFDLVKSKINNYKPAAKSTKKPVKKSSKFNPLGLPEVDL